MDDDDAAGHGYSAGGVPTRDEIAEVGEFLRDQLRKLDLLAEWRNTVTGTDEAAIQELRQQAADERERIAKELEQVRALTAWPIARPNTPGSEAHVVRDDSNMRLANFRILAALA